MLQRCMRRCIGCELHFASCELPLSIGAYCRLRGGSYVAFKLHSGTIPLLPCTVRAAVVACALGGCSRAGPDRAGGGASSSWCPTNYHRVAAGVAVVAVVAVTVVVAAAAAAAAAGPVVVDVVRAVEVCDGAGQRRGGQTALRSTHILFGANAVIGGASSSMTTGVPAPAALSCRRITATPAHVAAVYCAGPHVRVMCAPVFVSARSVRVRRAGKRALETIARTRMPCITFAVPSYTVTLRGFNGVLYSRSMLLAESGGGFKPNSCEDDIEPKGHGPMRKECDAMQWAATHDGSGWSTWLSLGTRYSTLPRTSIVDSACAPIAHTVAWRLAVRPCALWSVALTSRPSRLVHVPCRTYYVAMQVMFYLVAPP